MQTRKRAKPVKFGIKKETPPVEEVKEREEEDIVIEEKPEAPRETSTKVISHQEVVQIPDKRHPEEHEGRPIIISQNVQVTESMLEEEEEPEPLILKKEEKEAAESPMLAAQPIEEPLVRKKEIEPMMHLPEEKEEESVSEMMIAPQEESEPERIRIAPELEEPGKEAPEPEELPSAAFVTRESKFGGKFDEDDLPQPQESSIEESQRDEVYYDEPEEKQKNPFLFFLGVVLITFFLGLAFIGGVFYLTEGKSLPQMPTFFASEEVTPAPTKEPPTPTEEPPLDLKKYVIEIQNGGGITGEAAKLNTALSGEGFTIDGIGNADSSTSTETQISAKEGVDNRYLDKLKDSLDNTYVVADPIVPLPDSATTDVVVTIGNELVK